MRVMPKMIGAFLSVVLVSLVSGVFVVVLVISIQRNVQDVQDPIYFVNATATNYQRGANQLWIGTYILANGDEAMGNQYIRNGKRRMQESRVQLMKRLDSQAVEEFRLKEAAAIVASDRVLTSLKAQRTEQARFNLNFLQQRVDALSLNLSSFVDESQERMAQSLAEARTTGDRTIMLTIVAVVFSLLLSLGIAVFSALVITRPLRQLTVVSEKISKGELDITMPEIKTRDEVYELGEGLKGVLAAVQFLTDEVVKGEAEKGAK